MSAETLRYHWSQQEFLRAADAQVFDGRVELVDGVLWPVVIGSWHGPTTMRCGYLLSSADGYSCVTRFHRGEDIPVRHAGTTLSVSALLGDAPD